MLTNLIPTKIFKGENCLLENSKEVIIGKKAMIVTGKTSGEKSGALGDVITILEKNNVEYLLYNKITNNPTIEETVEGGKCARDFGADFLIGIGGGSPLDAAKAISVYAKNTPCENSDFEMYDIFSGTFKNEPLPMIAIPTTAGTGSEATQYSILTLHKEKTKRSFGSDKVFYKKAFLDGRYNHNIPLQIARNTYVDTLCHLIEGYTNKKSSDKTDDAAIKGLKLLGNYKNKFINGDFTVDDCTNLLYGSSIGGAVIAHTGTTIIHSMGYSFTYYKDIPHGRANGILLNEYMKETLKVLPDKVNNILNALNFSSPEEFYNYIDSIIYLEEKISEEEILEWAKTSILAKNVPTCPFDVDYEKEVCIYKKSIGGR